MGAIIGGSCKRVWFSNVEYVDALGLHVRTGSGDVQAGVCVACGYAEGVGVMCAGEVGHVCLEGCGGRGRRERGSGAGMGQ